MRLYYDAGLDCAGEEGVGVLVLWLRLRMWFGWGAPPDYDRALGRVLVLFSLWTVVFVTGYITVRSLLDGVPLGSILTSRLFVTLVAGIAVMMSPVWSAGLSRLWLAARGANRPLSPIYGRCFATQLSPTAYFARIGLSTVDAHWYALPLNWDVTVTPGDAEFELQVNPVTGYVERLRRLGSSQVDLRQDVGTRGRENTVQPAERDPGEATTEQRGELYRIARQERLRWAINPADVVVTGWTFIIAGLFFAPAMLVLAIYLVATYPHGFAPGGREAGLVGLTLSTASGLALIAGGIYLLHIWRRLRRLSATPAQTIEGTVAVWTPYKNLFSSGKGFLVRLQLADGSSSMFLVPDRFAHRVNQAGNRVALAYLPGTRRVLDVQPLEYAHPV